MRARHTTLLFAIASLATLVGTAACGRSSPDGGIDAVEIETVARNVAFDTPEELTEALDGEYLAGDTVLVQEADVTAIATDVSTTIATDLVEDAKADVLAAAFDSEQELRDVLDDTYLAFDTTVLSVGDVDATARLACFDTELELTTVLDDNYQDINFVPTINFDDLANLPAGFSNRVDNNTVVAVTPPLELNGTTLALDTNGCTNGEALVFSGGSFSCQAIVTSPATVTSLGAGAARPFEALPTMMKVDRTFNIAGANGNDDVIIYNAANPPPKNFLITDVWVVTTAAVTGAPTWKLRDGATDITAAEPIAAVNNVSRVATYANIAARNITVGETLIVRLTADATGNNAGSVSVFVLGVPN